MHIGVYLGGSDAGDAVRLAGHARRAEAAGLESAWVGDHLITAYPRLDSTLLLAAAAAVTSRIGLGFGVLVPALRPVAWVAKQIATLQLLSGNRLLLGVGTGGDVHGDTGWRAAGVPFAGRGKRTTDMLEVLPELVSGKPAVIGGETFTLQPGAEMPPLIIAGGEKTERRVARFGDEWFPSFSSLDQLRRQKARLAELAAEYGRPAPGVTVNLAMAVGPVPAAEVEAKVRGMIEYGLSLEEAREAVVVGSPAEVAERLAAFAEAGVGRVAAMPFGGPREQQIDQLGEVAALLR